MGFNKGEWSELYTFLYLLENPNLLIVNENLEVIEKNIFKILEIILSKCSYEIDNEKITKILKDGTKKDYKIDCISSNSKLLLEKILTHKKAKGSFKIEELIPLINNLLDGKKPKGSSSVKGDLEAKILDNNLDRVVNLNYNIKSNLGSPATLLNASNNTNFIYEVSNINDKIMNENNAINSRKKLLDRCSFLTKSGANIEFIKVERDIFDYNLKMIDSNLDKILGNMLYLSYTKNEKDIQKLISDIAQNDDECNFYKKKMADFTNAVTFGMMAGKKWNGLNEVNGGIILVSKQGEVYLLDLIYYKEVVNKYLIDNIKLDSPSSSRYKMFEIYKENDRYYFKLNLQIRFK